MQSILFIGHNAGRSGAPIVLLELMRWIRSEMPEIDMDLLLLDGGELLQDYAALARVRVASDTSRFGRLARRAVGDRLDVGRYRGRHDIVFGNTVLSLPYLAELADGGSRTVCWVHEMEYAITRFYTKERFLELSGKVDRFVAVSQAVARALDAFGVAGPVDVVPEVARPLPIPAADGDAVRRELGFPADAFLIGGGGTVEWRKGTDLFLQLAAMTVNAGPEICFVWIGGNADRNSEESVRVEHDLRRLGIEGRLKFTGITQEPEKYLFAIDAFALTSREDPFPLICLEAAGFAKPIVCFEKGGGMPEFVGDDCGFVVPYLELEAFRDRLITLAGDRAGTRKLGETAAVKVKRIASPAVVGNRIVELLEGLVEASRT